MKKIGTMFFPDNERHFTLFADDIENYQRPQRDKAFEYVRDWKCAVDGGANVGIFSRHFATKFERVIAAEPLPDNIECLRLNTPENVEVLNAALGDRTGRMEMFTTHSTNGGAFISGHEDVDKPTGFTYEDVLRREVDMIELDNLNLDHMGLFKLDTQGSEVIALKGALKTIARCRSVVLIEEKPVGGPLGNTEHIEAAAELLLGIGMTAREKVGADRIYSFD